MGESKLSKIKSELKPLGLTSMEEDEFRAKAQVFIDAGIRVKSHAP